MSSRIIVEPRMKFGSPSIEGSRIDPDTVTSFVLELGFDETLCSFPHLSRDDVLVGLWYAARYSRPKDWTPKQWRRLKVWLDDNEQAMWEREDWDEVPLP